MLIELPLGVLAAVRRGTLFEHTVIAVTLTAYSMPILWWRRLMIILLSGALGQMPISGRTSPSLASSR